MRTDLFRFRQQQQQQQQLIPGIIKDVRTTYRSFGGWLPAP